MFKEPSILISAIGGDIGQAVASCVRCCFPLRVVGSDMEPALLRPGLADQFYQIPPTSKVREYLAALQDICFRENAGYFFPISELEIKTLHEQRKEWSHWPAKVLINNEKVIENFLDKLKTVEYLKALGIRVPESVPLREYDGRFGFPLIVKARSGWGSRKKWVLEGPRELACFQEKDDGFLIAQEFVGSEEEEYTTAIFSDGQKVVSISFRRKLGFGGLSQEVALVEEPFLECLAEKIARSVGLIGSINLQSRKTGEIFVPFEINPRLSGTLAFRKTFGFTDCCWWMQVMSGKDFEYRKRYRSGKAIRYLSEAFFDLEPYE